MLLVDTDGSAVNKGAAKMLEDVQARIWRIESATEGTDNPLVSSTLESLEAERGLYQREIDAATIARWEHVQAAHMRARRDAARTNAELLEMAPEYVPAVRSSQARYDLEQAALETGEAAADFSYTGRARTARTPTTNRSYRNEL